MAELGLQSAAGKARMSAHSRREPNSSGRMGKPPLEFSSPHGSRDSRLIELVRVLARQAAREAYFNMLQERDQTDS